MKPDTQQMTYNKLDLLKLMYLSREGDRREGVLHRQSKGWFQVAGMGHETMAVFSMLLEDGDYLFPYYRDRAMVLARGVTNAELATAYFAKRGSSSGGRQMPGHYSDRARNIWSVPTPTGANALPACGVAWGMQMQGKSNIVLATVGDAASRQGEFYEAMSFAIERRLPIILVVEDNEYGISTNTSKFNPFKLGVFNEEEIVQVDARHPDRVFEAASVAIDKARSGRGPTIMWCQLDRLCSHTSSDDHRVYRPQHEIDEMMLRDPITVVARELIEAGELTESDWEAIKQEINETVDREYQLAENEQDPLADETLDHLFAEPPAATPPPIAGSRKWRMVDAINEVFRKGLEQDNRRVFFGEDIADPKGGVFRLTAGLSTSFPERVYNSPLAEATIAGVACGLASYGMRPVFELQFIDFVGPAWNQIGQNLCTLRWRTFGNWTCPAVIYAPYGAYLPGGSLWHSQANEALFTHVPGLRVVVPSTPEDAAALMWTALHAEDPTIFLIPKHLFRLNMEVGSELPAVGFGEARIRHTGDDVTVVAWGNCMEHSLEAAEQLAGRVSVEVIDLRSIQPWDKDTILQSLEKTGRLVVVQEDGESCSVGQMIISEIVGNPDSFSLLFSSPQLVAKPDVHIGYNPIYEYAALPSTEQVIAAIELTMED
ncbi:MAG TPA: thiamine pyrophosphate-dependent enzyme [Pirellulaceae bacterium]|nr:thiamine pyrophosphate-dependent enzyme [Pirellulaceae bacterium]HMO93278.1 thiamine pyrophosphate-dependent enzyme [Pirellulaceae bacterium]HMP70182.1 thiamine pyrophosphate-dependent enzyme [Pirellulaceae bacterium]